MDNPGKLHASRKFRSSGFEDALELHEDVRNVCELENVALIKGEFRHDEVHFTGFCDFAEFDPVCLDDMVQAWEWSRDFVHDVERFRKRMAFGKWWCVSQKRWMRDKGKKRAKSGRRRHNGDLWRVKLFVTDDAD